MDNRFTTAFASTIIAGRYTSHRSEVISYIFIGACIIALLYLIVLQIKSHK